MANIIRVVEIGKGLPDATVAAAADYLQDLGDLEIVTMDAYPDNEPDIIHDIREPMPEELRGAFDIVFLSHVLEHVEYQEVGTVVNNLATLLVPWGEFHVIVPDLAWAAQRVLVGSQTMGTAGVFWGSQNNEWEYHKSGFTLLSLRLLLERSGFIPRMADQTTFFVRYHHSNGEISEEKVRQNYIIGLLKDEFAGVE